MFVQGDRVSVQGCVSVCVGVCWVCLCFVWLCCCCSCVLCGVDVDVVHEVGVPIRV